MNTLLIALSHLLSYLTEDAKANGLLKDHLQNPVFRSLFERMNALAIDLEKYLEPDNDTALPEETVRWCPSCHGVVSWLESHHATRCSCARNHTRTWRLSLSREQCLDAHVQAANVSLNLQP